METFIRDNPTTKYYEQLPFGISMESTIVADLRNDEEVVGQLRKSLQKDDLSPYWK